jgi:hypothetical protein
VGNPPPALPRGALDGALGSLMCQVWGMPRRGGRWWLGAGVCAWVGRVCPVLSQRTTATIDSLVVVAVALPPPRLHLCQRSSCAPEVRKSLLASPSGPRDYAQGSHSGLRCVSTVMEIPGDHWQSVLLLALLATPAPRTARTTVLLTRPRYLTLIKPAC